MRSDYYRKMILDRSTKRDREALDREAARDAASSKKWKDRGSVGLGMEFVEKVDSARDWFKEKDQSAADWLKDKDLLDLHGRDAPKARSFNTGKQGGGMARDIRDGLAIGGRTRIPRVDDSRVLMQAGGYAGGLTETGRGTMAGELAPKGSMSVREAGEDMYELSKRRRGMQGGGAASSYNRRYNNQNK